MRTAMVLALLSGCVGVDAGPELSDSRRDLSASNGIWLTNGLNISNGLNLANGVNLANGLNLANGVKLANGITGPYIAPVSRSDLDKWIAKSPTMNTRILKYLVQCA